MKSGTRTAQYDGMIAENRKKHREIPVKVTAWVDAGIAPLVTALNEFPNIWTTNSCEGYGKSGHVNFTYHGDTEHFSKFMQDLSLELGKQLPDGGYKLTMAWTAGGERPLGEIESRREVVLPLSNAIRRIAINGVRMSQLRRGNRGTRPRNLIIRPNRPRSPL